MELVLRDAFSRDVFLIRAESSDDIRQSVDAFDRFHRRGHARRHDMMMVFDMNWKNCVSNTKEHSRAALQTTTQKGDQEI
tara:strand:- start:360 stop:599 length:240 start_codon:yes stop_codon:yes gene_type:complete